MPAVFVVCRRAEDSLGPGAVLGFACNVCGLALQVAETGRSALDDGAIPLCNGCGFEMAGLIEKERLQLRTSSTMLHATGMTETEAEAWTRAQIEHVVEREWAYSCAYCGGEPERLWIYQHEAFQYLQGSLAKGRALAHQGAGNLRICATCREAVEAGNWAELIQRALLLNLAYQGRKFGRESLIRFTRGWLAHRSGQGIELPNFRLNVKERLKATGLSPEEILAFMMLKHAAERERNQKAG